MISNDQIQELRSLAQQAKIQLTFENGYIIIQDSGKDGLYCSIPEDPDGYKEAGQTLGAIIVANAKAEHAKQTSSLEHVLMCQGVLKGLMHQAQITAESINRGLGGREVSLAITALQEAGHWFRDARELLEQTEE